MKRLWISFFLLTAFAFGADLTGTWKAVYESPDGMKRETVFHFKVDGTKLTGTLDSKPGGTSKISEGTVSGDEVQFRIVREDGGEDYRVRFRGKLDGKNLNLRLEWNEGEGGFDMTAHRVSD